MSILLKIILFPFSFLYGIVLRLRNTLYDWKILPSEEFNFPLIVVGNLSLGGTGKTPHTEFLLYHLQKNYQMATLSRGYGRKTKGFKIADNQSTPESIGDEPYQIYSKFNDNVIVAVDEKRKRGIEELRKLSIKPEVIVLDDAFQHRQVNAGLRILLTDFNNIYRHDCLVPAGHLREYRSAAKRANILIVSKCPNKLPLQDQEKIIAALKPKKYQSVYFTFISYQSLIPLNESAQKLIAIKKDFKSTDCLLFTAIANPKPIVKHLHQLFHSVESLEFRDHHFFQEKDYQKILKNSNENSANELIFVCSEKDAVKIDIQKFGNKPLFSIPIKIKFHTNKTDEFLTHINNYVKSYPRNS